MKLQVNVEELGLVTYTYPLFGKKTVQANGVQTTKRNKNTYEVNGKRFKINGDIFLGISLVYNGKEYFLTSKTTWYEYLLAFIPLIFTLFWGNSLTLCAIFPIVGGIFGCGFCGGMATLQIMAMKTTSKPLFKTLISLAVGIATIFILYLAYFIVVMAGLLITFAALVVLLMISAIIVNVLPYYKRA